MNNHQLADATAVAEPRILMDEKGRFLPGNAAGPGRPPGMKNAQTILMKAAPKLMRAYVKAAMRGNPTLLVDSRKWVLPDHDEAMPASTIQVFFSGDGSLPRLADDPHDHREAAHTALQISPPQVDDSPSPELVTASDVQTSSDEALRLRPVESCDPTPMIQ